jgi:hypothetical protein
MRDSSTHLQTITNQDGAAILDIGRGKISTLNQTGAYVWRALESGMPLDEIIQSLAQETKTDPEVIRADTNVFLKQLEQERLLLR